MKELVKYIAESLVESPEEVEVTSVDESLIELKVAEADRGKVIGRRGRTAHAIRTLLQAANRNGEAPTLDIVD